MVPSLPSIQEQLRSLADNLPAQVTWEDVLYEIYVLKSIEQGLADIAAGRTVPAEQAKAYLQQLRQQKRANSLE
ncbi:MAG: hypothetical protein EOO57_07730 [Hymenobacter sp.]|nr:MAG: hypothetical protein EOO57_07730 [Hymenobacter sp.]